MEMRQDVGPRGQGAVAAREAHAPRRIVALLMLLALSGFALGASAAGFPEKDELKLGFIKLTDCAPLVIAKELGYFEEEGLFVTLEAQANWKILLDRVISGELDGAHMLAGQPLGATIGIGTKADLITPFSIDRNGNAITVSNAIWEKMKAADRSLASPKPAHPISASALAVVARAAKEGGDPLKLAMVFPVSSHNYQLRYWLAAAGIRPGFYTATDATGTTDADVLISVTPPPQMPATLQQGTIHGYSVGEPWNQQAVAKKIGVPVVTSYEIWKNNPEKVFGVTRAWADAHPNSLIGLTKALIRAAKWLDASPENRRKAVLILAKSEYVGADPAVIAASMTGTFAYAPGDTRQVPDFNVFFRYDANYPFYSDAVWFLTQMRRWGQIPDARPDAWYDATARRVYRPDVYRRAAEALVAEGHMKAAEIPTTDGYRPPDTGFIDGIAYDGRKPNDYLAKFAIGTQSKTAPASAR